ncbi:hypothetical protein AD006_11810 [Pseudonocardia sp. EC080610-09]|jgi:hypothetical protein|uniref:hypothetical protein n=1 Tax=unclassified Pseudonocardia TaxID=2619320 RepID=UPI0006CB13E3|nr:MULTISPECIES: hypothetical protein [unclassified Pseudonocardia]ALE72503.1 hypothetical protein FRP1_04150 [Pseudonocardia sp. EC080625-04]ALL75816.1 hypothetical protein AD006_11810 [Pseudonocardia sp. EC080610-09]ALL82843.1 hypothetical protein AD017_19635 [Pseudonocardia sp. EC080619-01]
MDENTVDDRTTARDSACTCCGRRGARERLQVTGPGAPHFVAVCPYCDLQPAELQGWLGER